MDEAVKLDAFPLNESSLSDFDLSVDTLDLILSKITDDNLQDLKFLCKSFLKTHEWKKADDKLQFFEILKTEQNFKLLLVELLFTIQRFDLLNLTGICKHRASQLLQGKSTLDPLTKLLFNILDSLNNNDANDIANELHCLMNPSEHNLDLSAIFLELAFDENRSQSFLRILYLKLGDGNKFGEKLQNFISDSVLPSEVNGPSTTTIKTTILTNIAQVDDEFYDMNKSPCGICLIINIEKFHKTKPGHKQLKERTGTNIDRDKLEIVFKNFDFEVEIRNDLSCDEIKDKLSEMANLDHANYSCFIVCILSHGKEGLIAGSDSEYLDIMEDIVYRFSGTQCKSLNDKPKLFFIQACQGDSKMSPVYSDLETDGPNQIASEIRIPSHADILLSLATIPKFAAIRSESIGSLFMLHLTRELYLNGDKLDILDILRTVNKNIAKTDFKLKNISKKQMPYPSFTLTKKLIFRRKEQNS